MATSCIALKEIRGARREGRSPAAGPPPGARCGSLSPVVRPGARLLWKYRRLVGKMKHEVIANPTVLFPGRSEEDGWGEGRVRGEPLQIL